MSSFKKSNPSVRIGSKFEIVLLQFQLESMELELPNRILMILHHCISTGNPSTYSSGIIYIYTQLQYNQENKN